MQLLTSYVRFTHSHGSASVVRATTQVNGKMENSTTCHAQTCWTASNWWPPPLPIGRMDSGIRGHTAAIVDREKRGMELSENGRATSVVGCVGGRGTGRHECGRGRRSKILTTGGGSGMQQSASRRSTIESHQRTTRPVPGYSRHPPVPAHSPARPSVPFTLPPPTQAGRAATDVLLFDPPTPAASAWVWSVAAAHLPPVPARLSHHAPTPTRRWLTGPIRSQNRDGRAGGQPGMRQHLLVAGIRLHTKTMLLQYYEQFHVVTK